MNNQTVDEKNKMGNNVNPSKVVGGVKSVTKTADAYIILYETGEQAKLNILNSHVFKHFMSPNGKFPDYPEPINPADKAKIIWKKVTDYDMKAFELSVVKELDDSFNIHTDKIEIIFDKIKGTMAVFDKRSNRKVLIESRSLSYADFKATQILRQRKDEHFFGGGMQNGRFTHKGEIINIVNTNNWDDGGVTSPSPFYWSSQGYGVLRHTWQPGKYDFGKESPNYVKTIHKGEDFDAFYFINALPKDILNDYFELTGQPILIPEYAFYEAHLNAFNRDYWVKVTPDVRGAILFEDGVYYKCYQPNQMEDKVGILESLNGEKNNYQFSARAMVDRYEKHDMPLGWFVPNDGYGSGYGQTDSLAGDIENLKEFADYARNKGVEVALWTESQLEPADPENPKKGERDLSKEISVAGVVALKCDVAWIGSGYSFGLNAVEHATELFVKSTEHRPMIIMVDGWAGTQRYSGIWSGDQVGGVWEYIRFHIPTYIGSGLAGQPLVGSDMDGIYGGRSREVNIRDYQWKAFTPLQLSMDGWGNIRKSPFTFDDEATTINRAYLKLKSMMMPYNYTIGHESIQGLPMIRAMFLEFPEESPAYTKDSQYQYMWGPNVLVAPIYNPKGVVDASIRDGIYLPGKTQVWIDLLTGEKYQGGKIWNNMRAPLWKIPVFVKDGAIIPMANANNNPYEIERSNRIFIIYPNGESVFKLYEDDGLSSDYLKGHFATTEIKVAGPKTNELGDVLVTISKSIGTYKEMKKEKTTLLRVMASKDIEQNIKAAINGESIDIQKVETEEEFNAAENACYFKEDYLINPYLKELSGEMCQQKFLMIKIQKVDVTTDVIHIKIRGYTNASEIYGGNNNEIASLNAPSNLRAIKVDTASVTLTWKPIVDAIYYEIDRDGTIFTNITGAAFNFDGLEYKSVYSFRIRSVNTEGVSKWSEYTAEVEIADPYLYTVKRVKVSCNIPCQSGQVVSKLTDGNLHTIWHTKWDRPDEADPNTGKTIKLNFDLGDVYEIEKLEYLPRPDGSNGTIRMVRYKHSIDGKDWSQLSDPIKWKQDNTTKTIVLNEKIRYFELQILDSVGGFGAGRQVLFYMTPTSAEGIINDPFKNVIKGVKASCNLPCEVGQDIARLTDGDTKALCMWHTKWDQPYQTCRYSGKVIKLNFDLRDVYVLDKMEYYPRDDAFNGNILKLQYRYCIEGNDWNEWSDVITWNQDEEVKTIALDGAKFRYMELHLLETVGGYGSGRQVLFYKKVD